MYQLLQIVTLILAVIAMARSLARPFVSPAPASGKAAMRYTGLDHGCAVRRIDAI